jgi:tetratricopeptide (TPR) repeat protein
VQRIGSYEVLGELSKGGMGVLYRVRDPTSGAVLALKTIRLEGEAAQRRFAREAEALCQLNHPGVIRLHAVGRHAGQLYLVMDLAPGGSLQDRLNREGALPPREAVEVAIALSRAVAYVHAQGLLHRDLKPPNVLLLADGSPCLTDFGLVKEHDLERSRLTRSGAALGTPGFWAPEQALGHLDRVGPSSDVYGLGATLYALLTREAPVRAGSLSEHLARLSRGEIDPPSQLNPAVDAALDAVVLRCLSSEPDRRYPDATALGDDLERWAKGGAARARPPPWAGWVLGVGCAGVLAAWGAWRMSPTPQPLRDGGVAPSSTRAAPAPSPAEAARPADTLADQATSLIAAGDFRAALDKADAALALDPQHTVARLRRAACLAQLGQLEEALALLRELLAEDPELTQAHYLTGALLRAQGDHQGAVEAFSESLARKGRDAYTWWQRGLSRQELGALLDAHRDFNRALELDPTLVGALTSRGVLRASLSQFELAEQDLAAALDYLEPGDVANQAVGEQNLRNVREDLARSQAVRAQAREQDRLAKLALDSGDLAQADARYGEVIRLWPGSPVAHYNRGVARAQQGRVADALGDFGGCLMRDPAHQGAWFNFGLACEKLGRPQEAIDAWSELLQLDPKRGNAYHMRGLSWLQLDPQQPVRAARDFELALRFIPARAPQRAGAEEALRSLLSLGEPFLSELEALRQAEPGPE